MSFANNDEPFISVKAYHSGKVETTIKRKGEPPEVRIKYLREPEMLAFMALLGMTGIGATILGKNDKQ